MNANGYILHEDSERVVIATGFERPSDNAKTGNMIQVWILVKSLNPLEAIKTGQDSAICGDCFARGLQGKERTCYVNVGQAPLGIWRAYQAGSYAHLTDYSIFAYRKVRFGAYGDPVFIPHYLVNRIALICAGWTGYTHQWRNPLYAAYKRFFMASVETLEGAAEAQLQGWRTFRVSSEVDPTAREIECLSDSKGITCEQCRLCAGTSKGTAVKSIVIKVHGSGKTHFQKAVDLLNAQ